MLNPAYKIPKFVFAVASEMTKLEAPNLRMLSLYSIFTPIPIFMCVGLIVAQLDYPVLHNLACRFHHKNTGNTSLTNLSPHWFDYLLKIASPVS